MIYILRSLAILGLALTSLASKSDDGIRAGLKRARVDLEQREPDSAKSPPVTSSQPRCKSLHTRREWRTLSRRQQAAYLSAVKCLATKPSVVDNPNTTRLYDDFAWLHTKLVDVIHINAQFLPWHRWFGYTYHKYLVESCGYQGPMTYWAWEKDWRNLLKAPVFSSDPEHGFGTNGRGEMREYGRVVMDGAFANFTLKYPHEHLLQRDLEHPVNGTINAVFYGKINMGPEAMRKSYAQPDFISFFHSISGKAIPRRSNSPPGIRGRVPAWPNNNATEPPLTQHNLIHALLGGQMSNIDLSAIEPLFYPHHAALDRMWARWQDLDPENRIKPTRTAYSGSVDYEKDDDDASVHDTLRFHGLSETDPTVLMMLDTRSWPLCYEYDS